MDLLQRLEKATPRSGDRVDQYELLEELGRGGCGVVFRAHNHRLGDDVALKVMLPQLAPAHLVGELFRRFEREANILRTLRHPHVVRITDLGRTLEGFPYFVMELVEGPTLERVLAGGPIDEERTARIAAQVLDALEFAHGRGVVHRDLKPGNVMLRSDYGVEDFVTVLDFGIAKLLDGEATMLTTSVSGTPWYMAPEQAKLESELDGRIDLYALGLILAECLTGRRVVKADQPFSAAVVHASDEPLVFEDDVLASRLAPVITRATTKDRDARFSSAPAMREALLACVAGAGERPMAVAPRGAESDASTAASAGPAGDSASSSSEDGADASPAASASAPETGPPAPADDRSPSAEPRAPAPRATPGPTRSVRWPLTALGVAAALTVFIALAVSRSDSPAPAPGEAAAASGTGSGSSADQARGAVVALAPDLSDALACAGDDPTACQRLAEARLANGATEEDWRAARPLLERACDGESAPACAILGEIYRQGHGVLFDLGTAARYYQRACALDPRFGCVGLGALRRDRGALGRNIAEAGELFERACQAGAAEGCNELGRLLEQGLDGVQDDVRAARYYERACDGGYSDGCANLGLLLQHGDDGRANWSRVNELFQRACQSGSALGCMHLGLSHLEGRGFEASVAEARSYLSEACEGGLSVACQRLQRLP